MQGRCIQVGNDLFSVTVLNAEPLGHVFTEARWQTKERIKSQVPLSEKNLDEEFFIAVKINNMYHIAHNIPA